MKSLGNLTQPVLIFGGPYSNLDASKAMFAQATKLGFSAAQVICTGDVVAYCAEPAETCSLIQDWGIHVVMGNCEESLGFDESDCGCGFDEGSDCSLLSITWYEYAQQRVNADYRRWMRDLPRSLCFEMSGKTFRVVHGSVDQINQFVFKSTDKLEKINQIALSDTDIVIGGHCGLPFADVIDDRAWLNAGVIGMPANDASSDGWYMILQPAEQGVDVSWHRLQIDATESAGKTANAGMTEYATALTTGFWPNMDILPTAEKSQRGLAIELDNLHIASRIIAA